MSEQAAYYGATDEDDDLSYTPAWWLGVVVALAAGVVLLPVVWGLVWLGATLGMALAGVR